jgi:hypothetical protein
MTERSYRLIVGLSVLAILYFNSRIAMYALITLLVFEAMTNWRVPRIVSRLRRGEIGINNHVATGHHGESKFRFEAERALRLMFSGVLVVTYLLFGDQLWLIPWFAGFALTVAGLSGICPMLLFFEKLGFRPSSDEPATSAQV